MLLSLAPNAVGGPVNSSALAAVVQFSRHFGREDATACLAATLVARRKHTAASKPFTAWAQATTSSKALRAVVAMQSASCKHTATSKRQHWMALLAVACVP